MREVRLSHVSPVSGIFRVQASSRGVATLIAASGLDSEIRLAELLAVPGGVEPAGLEIGDVVKLNAGQSRAVVRYRASDRHQTLFVTNQCNSRCLMCSQPPTPQEDGWLFNEATDIVNLVMHPPVVVGISGGEPTLHPARLRALLDLLHSAWPDTKVEVLTNGRRLAEEAVTATLLQGLAPGRTNWLVPLYAGNDELHDFVVQSPGAFDETLAGLLNLQEFGQAVQLRTVMVRPVITELAQWASFVGRNLPFVQAVALMATEPVGFALANKEMTVIDVPEYGNELKAAVDELLGYGLRPVLMNMPLCKLPETLRPLAAVSISDWKNDYAAECHGCELRPGCAGFFVWDNTKIYRTGLRPVLKVEREGSHV